MTTHEYRYRIVKIEKGGCESYQAGSLNLEEVRDAAETILLESKVTRVLILEEYGEFEVKTTFTKTPVLVVKRGS